MTMNHGKFIISLDFELLWGVRDKKTIAQYGENIRGVHQVIPTLLRVFDSYQVKATFATVGFLFCKNKAELSSHIPATIPTYQDSTLSPYLGHFELVGETASEDPYHYAPHLIKLIQQQPQHEISTHTFSHYYCLEPGQTTEDFRADLVQAQQLASNYGITITSIVFPRNQYKEAYLQICKDLGIYCYRGNEHSWLYTARNEAGESLLRRGLRLIDAYFNVSGHHSYTDDSLKNNSLVNVPSSRFLRPYSRKLSWLDGLRLRRITKSMTYAAKHQQMYHLWWHPHNFGINQAENVAFLEKILAHYTALHQQYGFQTYTMSSLANSLRHEAL